jgi:Tfp pilus assembly protein FimT
MKTHMTHEIAGERGIALIECLVYMGLVVVVLAVAMTTFYQCWDDSKNLRRDADDIVRALHAGEQWRSDVRAATGPVRLTNTNDTEQLRIPVSAHQIIYTFSRGELRRRVGSAALDKVLLSNVKSLQMQSDLRQHVTAWRWELELKPVKKRTSLRPLFTFETVAGSAIIR